MMRPARVLFLAERFPPDIGGVARSAGRTAAALQRLGIDVHALTWTRQLPPGVLQTSNAGVTLHRMGLFGSWDLSLQHTLNVLQWLHETRRFEMVWGHYLYPAGFAGVLFGQLAGVKCVVSARGNDVDRLMFPPGDFARLMWTLQRADGITAVSRDLSHKIDVLLGGNGGARVVHNVVDAGTFSPGDADLTLRRRLGIGEDEAVLAFCGELRHKKGAEFLLGALREVRKVRPACLLIIGQARHDESPRLAAFAQESPADGTRVIVTGHLENPADVAAHLRLADVALFPSLWDGLPNALLEAMACARTVIASDAGGIPELITHGVNGWLVPRSALHRLGEAAIELLAQPAEIRKRLGEAARRHVLEHFNADVEAAELAATIRAVFDHAKSDHR